MFILDTERTDKVRSLAISHDGALIALRFPNSFEIWSLGNRTRIETIQLPSSFETKIYFSLCRRYVCVFQTGGGFLFDIEQKKGYTPKAREFIPCHILSDENQLVTGITNSKSQLVFGICCLSNPERTPIKQNEASYFTASRYAFTKDGNKFIRQEYREPLGGSLFALRSTITGELIRDIPGQIFDSLRCFNITADEKRIYSINDKYLYEQDSETGSEIRRILKPKHSSFVELLMHPNWKIMLSAHTGKLINVWDADTLDLKTTYAWPIGNFSCITISPDGLIAAAGNAHGKVVVWDLDDV